VSSTILKVPDGIPHLTLAQLAESRALLISQHSLPEADAALLITRNGEAEVQVQYFEEYLRFLELACWNESLVIGWLSVEIGLDPNNVSNDFVARASAFGTHAGAADLQMKTLALLKAEGVLSSANLTVPKDMLRPDQYVRRLLKIYPTYKQQTGLTGQIFQDEHSFERALAWYSIHHGVPFALTELARRAGITSFIPSASHNTDIDALDAAEETIETNVVTLLRERLSTAERSELQALRKLGAKIALPPSPVTAWILREARSADQIPQIAMQVRTKLKAVRDHVSSIQAALLDETQPVSKRLKFANEIEHVLKKLNPDGLDLKKELQSHSTFIDGVHQAVTADGPLTLKKVADVILSNSIERIFERVRYRKYRVLFDMRNKFLNDAGYHEKLCSLFGLNIQDPGVRVSLDYCGHAKLNAKNHRVFDRVKSSGPLPFIIESKAD